MFVCGVGVDTWFKSWGSSCSLDRREKGDG